MMRLNVLSLCIANACAALAAQHVYAVEFDTAVVAISGMGTVDLSRFENDNPVAGDVFVGDIWVNHRRIDRNADIKFYRHNDEVKVCIPISSVSKFGLKKSHVKEMPLWHEDECADVMALNENIDIQFNDERQELSVSIPQAFFLYADEFWDHPGARSEGISGVVLDYSIYDAHMKRRGEKAFNSLSSFGNVGVNVGAWRFRADYQYDQIISDPYATNKRSHFEWRDVYAFIDLPEQSAKLRIGDSSLKTGLFDSVAFRGLAVYTDENMLPPSVRGYAPQITGIARTNAVVTISQRGNVITKVDVPPGPFVIEKLSQYSNGTLDVRIEEQDGGVIEYQVVTTSIPFLSRKGVLQYKANIGKLKSRKVSHQGGDDLPKILSAEASYGLSNDVSVFGGVFSSLDNNEYESVNLGVGANLQRLGAVSFDVTRSMANIKGLAKASGNSYRFNYAKRIESTDSQIHLTGYRFSEKEYMSVTRFADIKNGYENRISREKNMVTLAMTQNLARIDASISLSGSKSSYWRGESQNSLGLNFSKAIRRGALKGASLSLGMQKYKTSDAYNNNTYMLTFSMPLEKQRFVTYNSSYNNNSKAVSHSADVSQTFDKGSARLSFRSEDGLHQPTISAYADRRLTQGAVSLGVSYNADYHSVNSSLRGSLTATRHGMAAHGLVSPDQPRLMVDAGRGNDQIPLNRGDVVTNRLGVAVVSNIPAYYRSQASVDLTKMPEGLNVDETNLSITLTDGAIGYETIKAQSGDQVLAHIEQPDGTVPPFGAFVYDLNTGEQLGMVSEHGRAYIAGVNAYSVLRVHWGGDERCTINVKRTGYDAGGLNEFICE